jgi:hypothetical protein
MVTRGRKPDDACRQAVVVLRAQGLHYPAIGSRLGITRQCAQQQLLKASCHSVVLPGICCIGCATVIVKGRGPSLHGGPVYCLGCLAKTPNVPFGQRLKAHRLAAGLTLRQLSERVAMSAGHLGTWSMACRTTMAYHRQADPRLGLGPGGCGQRVGRWFNERRVRHKGEAMSGHVIGQRQFTDEATRSVNRHE